MNDKEYTKAKLFAISGGYKIVLSYPGNYEDRFAGVWERDGFKYREDAIAHLNMMNEDLEETKNDE